MQIGNNLNAMQTGIGQLGYDAHQIANKTTQGLEASEGTSATSQTSSDFSRNLIDTINTENGFDAQINSVRTQNQMMGTLLDIVS